MELVIVFLSLLNLMLVIGSAIMGNYAISVFFGFFGGPAIALTAWAFRK